MTRRAQRSIFLVQALLLASPLVAGCGTVMLRTGSPTFRAGVSVDASVRGMHTGAVAGDAYASGVAVTEGNAMATANVGHGGGQVAVVGHGEPGGAVVVQGAGVGAEVSAGGSAGAGAQAGARGAVMELPRGQVDVIAHGESGGSVVVEGYGGGAGAGAGAGTASGTVTATATTPGGHLVVGGPVTLDASAAGRAPVATGRGAGVRGTAGASAHLGALLEAGLDVDGMLLGIADVGPLELSGGAEVDGRFAGDSALEAFLTVEHGTLPRDGGETRVTVRVRGAAPSEARGPVDIHLVLDRSSSMQGSWGEAVDAAKLLVDGLTPTDRIHIVAYGTEGEEVLPPRAVGDGALVHRALDRIRVGGGTNIEAGLDIAYREVRRAPARFGGRSLVILVSDGVPNEGELGAEGLSTLAGRARTGRGCKTTVIGLGDQFDAAVLSAIAQEGRGGYYLARSAAELAPALTAELMAHASVAARDVELSLDLGEGAEVVHVFDGHAGTVTEEGRVQLSIPHLAAGEERRIVVRIRVAAGAEPRALASAQVRYKAGGQQSSGTGEAWMAFGARAQVNTGAGGWHAVEADLGEALAYAGRQVRYGNGDAAAVRLRAHAQMAQSHPAYGEAPRLGHRSAAVGRLATALDTLTTAATHRERRQVGLSLGALSVRFGR